MARDGVCRWISSGNVVTAASVVVVSCCFDDVKFGTGVTKWVEVKRNERTPTGRAGTPTHYYNRTRRTLFEVAAVDSRQPNSPIPVSEPHLLRLLRFLRDMYFGIPRREGKKRNTRHIPTFQGERSAVTGSARRKSRVHGVTTFRTVGPSSSKYLQAVTSNTRPHSIPIPGGLSNTRPHSTRNTCGSHSAQTLLLY